MLIGDAAAAVGLEPHVLRHWDALGVVVPDRTPSGRRHYTDEHVHRMRIVLACRRVGLSLAEIRVVLHRHADERDAVLRRRIEEIRERRARLAEAEAFLRHVLACRHDLVTRCRACSGFGG